MSAFYNSLDFTVSVEENHNALRKDLAQGLDHTEFFMQAELGSSSKRK